MSLNDKLKRVLHEEDDGHVFTTSNPIAAQQATEAELARLKMLHAQDAYAAAQQRADWSANAPQIRSASEDSATIAADDARRYAQSVPGKVGAWWDGLSDGNKMAVAAGGGAVGGAMAAGLGAVALRKKLRAARG